MRNRPSHDFALLRAGSAVRSLLFALAVSTSAVACAQADLFAVVRDGTPDEVAAAVSRAADPTRIVDSFGQDLLVYAATGNPNPAVIRYLVSRGFNVNQFTPSRWTPLMYAVRFNPEPAIAMTLLELGASVSAVNAAGQVAADLASENPNPSYASHPIMALLLAPAVPQQPQQTQRTCCRVCRTGKACGDSCISRSYTCHRGVGCACNAVVPDRQIDITHVLVGQLMLEETAKLAASTCSPLEVAVLGRFRARPT